LICISHAYSVFLTIYIGKKYKKIIESLLATIYMHTHPYTHTPCIGKIVLLKLKYNDVKFTSIPKKNHSIARL